MGSSANGPTGGLWNDQVMRKVLAGTLLVVACAFAFAGCGGGGTQRNDNGEAAKSANQIFADAVKAANSATFMRLNGNMSSCGRQVGLDMRVAKNNHEAKGSFTINDKYAVQLIVVGKDGYLHASTPEFWTKFAGAKGTAIAQALDGGWLKFPVNDPHFGPLVSCASPRALFDQLKTGTGSTLKNKGTTTYQGQTVVVLDGGQNGMLYVATNGIAYPAALVKKGKGGGTITFSAWNQPVSVTAPTTNVVDVSQLPG